MTLPFPENIAERERLMLDEVYAQRMGHEWFPLELRHAGRKIVVGVSRDAMRIGGVRATATADTLWKIATVMGALPLTPRMADQIHQQASVIVAPITRTWWSDGSMAKTARMVEQSQAVDSAVAEGRGLVSGQCKDWVLTRKANRDKAANYGWHVRNGGNGAVTSGLRVLQPLSTAHNWHHVDYCLAPDMRVLTADLRWVEIQSVDVGQELIGFDEKLGHCILRGSTVETKSFLTAECFEVVTDRGTVIASAEHRWVLSRPFKRAPHRVRTKRGEARTNRAAKEWVRTAELRQGAELVFYSEPWTEDRSWDGGWLAGFLDGEGWVGSNGSIGFGQNPGPLLERACGLLEAAGYETRRRANKQGCVQVRTVGRLPVAVIGQFRPQRLLEKSRRLWEGKRPQNGMGRDNYARVLEIRPLGERLVVGLGTTTKTLIAEGFLTHNSQGIRLMSRACKVDGIHRDLGDVLADPELCGILSHEGPIMVLDPRRDTEPAPPPSAAKPTKPPPPDAQSGDEPGIPYLPARNAGAGGNRNLERKRVDLLVIHTMEAPEKPKTARAVAQWFAGPNAPKASAHWNVDADEIVQSVLERHIAWHAPGANGSGIGIEHAGYARQTEAQWLDAYSLSTLSRSAWLAARICKRWNIPIQRLSITDLRAGHRGFCGHIDVSKAWGKSTHTDPGPNFPWSRYLAMVRAELEALG